MYKKSAVQLHPVYTSFNLTSGKWKFTPNTYLLKKLLLLSSKSFCLLLFGNLNSNRIKIFGIFFLRLHINSTIRH